MEESRLERLHRRALVVLASLGFTLILGVITLFGVIVFAFWMISHMFHLHQGD